MRNDYYPFGMIMPGRKYSAGTGYRYGFNGKEIDNDVAGDGNQYDYGFRIYNPRIGRFLSEDPLTKSYPWYTPYQFAGNKPISCIDLDGLEELWVTNNSFAPFDLFGRGPFGGYSGDGEDRKFGDNGTYRTSGTAHINLTTAEFPTFSAGRSTSTFHRKFGPDYTHESPSKIEKSEYFSSQDRNYHHVEMHVSGSNGAVVLPKMLVPDIDAHLNIHFEKNPEDKTRVLIHGRVKGDKFPANETILTDKAGNWIVLGVSGPNSGKDVGPSLDLPLDLQKEMYDFRMTVLFNEDETIKGVELNNKQYSAKEWNDMFLKLDPKSKKAKTTTNNKNGTTEIIE